MNAFGALGLARDYALLRARLPFAAPPLASHAAPRKVLFLGYAAIGDLIFLMPALRALRQGLPQARIVFVGDEDLGSQELLPHAGVVDEIWRYTHARLETGEGRAEIARRIAAEEFDAVIVSQGTPLRPFARAILKIPTRIGHHRAIEAPHEGWSSARYALWRLRRGMIHSEWERRWALNVPVWTPEQVEHVVSRNLKLVQALGVATPAVDASRPGLPLGPQHLEFAERALPKEGHRKTVGIHLGSSRTQFDRLWPAERWGEVATHLVGDYGCRIALFGGPDERAKIDAFRSSYQARTVDLVGHGNLLESFAAIARCDLFLSSDTGPAKAAMACGVPTVTVWGPTSPRDHGVVWDAPLHADFTLNLSCSPCVRMSLRQEGSGVLNYSNCLHHDCLLRLTSDSLAAAIRQRYHTRLT